MKVLLLNGPDDHKDTVMVRSGDRFPRRIPRKLFKETVVHVYPIFLAYTASVLRENGITPLFLDAIIEDLTLEETVERIKGMSPDMLVVDTSTPTINIDLRTTERVKEGLGIPTVLVDTHATTFHQQLINEPYVDFIVRGEFEIAVGEIATYLRDGKDPRGILGITFNRDGQVVITPERPLLKDLDTLPYPDRELIPQSNYRQELTIREPYFQMLGGRGCPFRCSFCLWPHVMWRHKVRLRRPDKVVDEIEFLQKKYGAREIYLYDDTVNVSIKRVEALCNAILERGIDISWTPTFRADSCSPEMYRLMRKAGCRNVVLGVETGSQWLLDEVIHKELTLDQVRNSVRWAREAGIAVHCTFMIGFPGETKETLKQTSEFIKEIEPDTVQVSLATPYPGTPLYEQVKHLNRDWEDFDGVMGESFCDFSAEELHNAMHRIYLDYYLSPRRIARKVFGVRGWDDLKANWLSLKGLIGRYLATGLPKRI